jgi:hypothetical protein
MQLLFMANLVKPAEPSQEKAPQLTPEQLCEIAGGLVEAKDPAEIARLRKEFERGFYGDSQNHA